MPIIPKSLLNPETSVMLGLANGGIVVGIYSYYLPSNASVRTADPMDNDVEKTRRAAAWSSAAVLGMMYLLTKDRNSFLIGGLVLAAVDMTVKHSNGINPFTNKLDDPAKETMDSGDGANVYSMPDYAEDTGVAAY